MHAAQAHQTPRPPHLVEAYHLGSPMSYFALFQAALPFSGHPLSELLFRHLSASTHSVFISAMELFFLFPKQATLGHFGGEGGGEVCGRPLPTCPAGGPVALPQSLLLALWDVHFSGRQQFSSRESNIKRQRRQLGEAGHLFTRALQLRLFSPAFSSLAFTTGLSDIRGNPTGLPPMIVGCHREWNWRL